ncbi:uncharacterized protein HMPREF1541_09803 [Cyphellophora europaea CBS 101466]|uniref:Uncharacterized protein n=1 Tax=Cyphellophora europaea (strain CBS 101466) TaxID=1220924 RepID=W2SA92_CYPE1|nr:uncharacterized protein HMPREF1541_09803 [Cyphellophora europaea CBS 101466]ETN44928.1 hypothetical protein HMPREF1541_09803 [Cyphellophora europaea CBS 101466]
MPQVRVLPPDPSWPAYFALFAHQISTYLITAQVPYTTILHIGSTSIRHLAAKPNIDIVILVADAASAERAANALVWEPPPQEYYKRIGDGGIRGRLSLKFQDLNREPRRSVYVVHEGDAEGMLGLRGYLDLKRVLEEDEVLKREYEAVKWGLLQEGVTDGVVYGRGKDQVIAKILKAAGWADEEVRRKEELDHRVVGEAQEWREEWPY